MTRIRKRSIFGLNLFSVAVGLLAGVFFGDTIKEKVPFLKSFGKKS